MIVMGNSININWNDVRNLSKNILENYDRFEKSRKNIEGIVESMPDCWEGVDANAFESNLGNYLKLLEKDTKYFEYLGNYFEASSTIIGGTVETYTDKFARMDEETSRGMR